MKDKVCVITGGTDGIGKAAAYDLAVQGARLLIHGRDPDKGARVVEELRARSRNPAIEFLQADFGSLAEVRRLAAAILARAPRIDVLANNAGGIFARRLVSQDGYEMTFAVNHLAPFLLTRLLLDALRGAAPSRIVTTSSRAHQGARIPFADLQATRRYSAMGAYGSSKLANILFTRALAKRLQGTSVTATCLHPGFVRTGFGRGLDASPVARHLFRWLSLMARTPEKGAQTLVYLAAAAQVAGASGGYYVDCRLTPPSAAAQDEAAAERLWQVSEQLVG
jgi:NAD(P)-dependent dehydrogenase (short-subunit alcohol dehydrogenase family)